MSRICVRRLAIARPMQQFFMFCCYTIPRRWRKKQDSYLFYFLLSLTYCGDDVRLRLHRAGSIQCVSQPYLFSFWPIAIHCSKSSNDFSSSLLHLICRKLGKGILEFVNRCSKETSKCLKRWKIGHRMSAEGQHCQIGYPASICGRKTRRWRTELEQTSSSA